MAILPCSIASNSHKESKAQSNYLEHSESPSLSSLPSLPSVPSLTSHSQNPSTHHECLSTLTGHTSYVFCFAVAGNSLYSGSSDNEIRIWNIESNTNSGHVVAAGKSATKSIVILRDKLFTAHQDHKIRVWQIDNQNYKLLATLPTLKDRLLRYLPPKNHVQVRRHKKCTWVHHVDTISALAISKDGCTLYSVSWDRTLKIWRTSDFRCLESVINAHDDAINALAVSGDGFIYTGSADTKIKVWNKLCGEKKHSLVATLEKHRSAINGVALTSDGSVLYSGACDRSIVVWERESGASHMVVVGALRGHVKAILCLTMVSDMVCSGSADKTVRIWKRGVDKGYSCLAVLEGHRGPIKCLAAAVDPHTRTPSGITSHLIYSGSLDCDIRVWQLLVPSLEEERFP
ncbi:transducin/WD40 repeat-like superfamily protein [Tasmannia lanceolata]|uniref:transducin/WD40 repeat-like superfamily protein n=1 Tax=Tasmannia lanceolata TaxID=3420 RepID=UPI004062AFB6